MPNTSNAREIAQGFLLDLKLETDVEIEGDLETPFASEWRVNKITIGKFASEGGAVIKLLPSRVKTLVEAGIGRHHLQENEDPGHWVLLDPILHRCWMPLVKESVLLARGEP